MKLPFPNKNGKGFFYAFIARLSDPLHTETEDIRSQGAGQ
jgi:hypothetical protein